MLQRSSGPRFGALALLLTAAPGSAQVAQRTDARVRFVEPSGAPLPPDFVIVRDEQGRVRAPAPASRGTHAFSNVGRKVTFEFTRKDLKSSGLELVLEPGPVVYVTLCVDPNTGKVKEVSQKVAHPPGSPRDRAQTSAGQRMDGKPGDKLRRPGQGTESSATAPGNDACADALPLFDGVTAFTTLEATTDGAPDPNGQYDGQTYEDIWYLYTPTCIGTLTVSTCGTADYDTDLALYEADTDGDGDHDLDDCASITSGVQPALASNDDAGLCAGFTSLVAAPVTAERQYIVRIGGFSAGHEGSGSVLVSCGGAPSNDTCSTPRPLTCGTSIEVTNSAATTAPGDPEFGCAFAGPTQGDGTLWFSFVATSSSAFVSTSGGAGVADTLLAVYGGSCGSLVGLAPRPVRGLTAGDALSGATLVELACDDDSGVGLLSQLCVGGLTVGETYLVQVASFPGTDLGRIRVDLGCPGPCEVICDEESEACPLPCNGSVTADNSSAHTDPLDPLFSCAFGGPAQGTGTLWLEFVAAARTAKIDTNASAGATDTLLAVYDESGQEIACSDDEGLGLLSEVCLEGLTVGDRYRVQVASFDPFSVGEITVTATCPCGGGPINDECADAADLGPLPATVAVDVTQATDDVQGPCEVFSGPFANVWYSVTGTGGELRASTCNAGTQVFDTKISVFCADCGALVCVAGSDDDCAAGGPVFASTATWCSQAGARYLITVGTFSPFTTPGVLQLDVSDLGTGCTADVQCFPQGACCLGEGTCALTTEVECAQQGGTYRGDGSACTAEAVADGGFEAGPFGGAWSEFSANFGTPVCDSSCGSGGGSGARSGSKWAWFGGVFTFEEASLEQSLLLPEGASSLEFFLEIPVSSGNGVDFLRVEIDGLTVFEVFEDDGLYSGIGYDPVSIPLAAFADGGAHTLRFESIITGDDGAGQAALTNFFVDDVSIASPAEGCETCFTLDFETEDDFETPLRNGQSISTPPEFGRRVSLSSAGANAGAAIFDSSVGGPNDPSQDRDLLVGRGKLLILQNSQVRGQTDGAYDRPNDDQDGGDFLFDFARPVRPTSLVLVDIDAGNNQASSVVLTDVDGKSRTFTVPARWTEDLLNDGPPGWRTLDLTSLIAQPGFDSTTAASEQPGFDPANVVRIRVHLGSSGAVDDLSFCE